MVCALLYEAQFRKTAPGSANEKFSATEHFNIKERVYNSARVITPCGVSSPVTWVHRVNGESKGVLGSICYNTVHTTAFNIPSQKERTRDVSLGVYRLYFVEKHAGARQVDLSLFIAPTHVKSYVRRWQTEAVGHSEFNKNCQLAHKKSNTNIVRKGI